MHACNADPLVHVGLTQARPNYIDKLLDHLQFLAIHLVSMFMQK